VINLRAEAGKTYRFIKYFAVFTDNDPVGRPLPEAAIATVQQARLLGYEVCLGNITPSGIASGSVAM